MSAICRIYLLAIIALAVIFSIARAEEKEDGILLVQKNHGNYEVFKAAGETIHTMTDDLGLIKKIYGGGKKISFDTIAEPAGFFGFNTLHIFNRISWKKDSPKITGGGGAIVEIYPDTTLLGVPSYTPNHKGRVSFILFLLTMIFVSLRKSLLINNRAMSHAFMAF